MIRDMLLGEFDHEMAATRRVLGRCPATFACKPHPRSFSLGDLATHLARLPHWGEWILDKNAYDMVRDAAPSAPAETSLADVLQVFDHHNASVRAHLVAKSDAELAGPWSLQRQGVTLMTLPRMSAFKTFVVNHTIHHRGQLTVYLRLQDVPVPALYGPSADEDA